MIRTKPLTSFGQPPHVHTPKPYARMVITRNRRPAVAGCLQRQRSRSLGGHIRRRCEVRKSSKALLASSVVGHCGRAPVLCRRGCRTTSTSRHSVNRQKPRVVARPVRPLSWPRCVCRFRISQSAAVICSRGRCLCRIALARSPATRSQSRRSGCRRAARSKYRPASSWW